MSGYVRSTKLEDVEFDGEAITGVLEQLSLPDLLLLQGTDVASDEDAAKVLAEIVPKYVKDFGGLSAKDGTPIGIEEVCGKAYFLDLSMKLGRKLLEAARPPSKPSVISGS